MIRTIEIHTTGQGLFEFTDRVREVVANSGVEEGVCTIMIQHTSASLTIQENADPPGMISSVGLNSWYRKTIWISRTRMRVQMTCHRISKQR